MGAQINVKQVKGLKATIDSILGIDNIVESFTTTAIDGDTGIVTSYMAKETDAIQIFINGQKLQEGYSWKKAGVVVTSDSLEAGTELVWSSSIVGYDLDATDEIQLQYDTLSSGNNTLAGNSGISGTVNGSLIPDTNEAYDLGSADKKFRDLYLSSNTIYMGGQPLSVQNGNLVVNGTTASGIFDTTNSTATASSGVFPQATDWALPNITGFAVPYIYISADESKVWVIEDGGDIIEVHSWDPINNTTTLLAASTFTALGLTPPNYYQQYTSRTGDSIYWHGFDYIDLVGGNLAARAQATYSGATPRHTFNKNLQFIYDQSFGFKMLRYDGANWNEEILSPGTTPNNSHHNSYNDIRKQGDDTNVIALIKDSFEDQATGPLEIIRYDGTNWNIEFTDTDVADAALSPDGTMLAYYKSGNYITMTYSGGTWSNLNTLPGTDYTWGEMSISVNKDTLVANEKFYRLDSNQWTEVPTILGELYASDSILKDFTSASSVSRTYENRNYLTFSQSNNNRLISGLRSSDMYKSLAIPSDLSNIASNTFIYDTHNVYNFNGTNTRSGFWDAYRNQPVDNSFTYTFQDTLVYQPGDTVMIYNNDYSLILYAWVLSNDTNTNTIEVLPQEWNDAGWQTAIYFNNTFNIKRG